MRNQQIRSYAPKREVPGWLLLISLTSLWPLLAAEPSKASVALHTATLETGKLRAVVADNEAYAPTHLAGYNGVAELQLAGANQPNLFVPLYAGLNFEHIFSGDAASYGWHIF